MTLHIRVSVPDSASNGDQFDCMSHKKAVSKAIKFNSSPWLYEISEIDLFRNILSSPVPDTCILNLTKWFCHHASSSFDMLCQEKKPDQTKLAIFYNHLDTSSMPSSWHFWDSCSLELPWSSLLTKWFCHYPSSLFDRLCQNKECLASN